MCVCVFVCERVYKHAHACVFLNRDTHICMQIQEHFYRQNESAYPDWGPTQASALYKLKTGMTDQVTTTTNQMVPTTWR